MYNKLPKKELKQLFVYRVTSQGGECSSGNPFLYKKGNTKCYVFIKNISPAYFKNYPDNSRVQIPRSEVFEAVTESNLDFLVLGYDSLWETWVAWDPSVIKDRLNEKRNISVYSRFSWQKDIDDLKFTKRYLGNDERIYLFRSNLLHDFLDRYKELFNLEGKVSKSKGVSAEIEKDISEIKRIIMPLLKEHKVLQAVSDLKKTFDNRPGYEQLAFKDWFKIVDRLYSELDQN